MKPIPPAPTPRPLAPPRYTESEEITNEITFEAVALAIEDIRSHAAAWIKLLTAYVNSLPPDTPPTAENEGNADRSYAEHELRAMKRDLAALLAISLTE